MKFSQLQVGQRFRFRNTVYTKTGPIQAMAEGGLKVQMIPRSAVVEEVDAMAPPVSAASGRITLERGRLLALFDAYHRESLQILHEGGADVEGKLTAAHGRAVDALRQYETG
jgi:hypothetical protein